MPTKADSTDKKKNSPHIAIISGLFTGMFCSALFNPWDRALYLSTKNRIPFLSRANFTSPYQGFSQAIIQRAFLGSIYFIMQREINHYMQPHLETIGVNETAMRFYVGMFAGTLSGVLTNGPSAVKYHMWGKEGRTFFKSVHEMWVLGGYKSFLKGTLATVHRDAVFGIVYESLRAPVRMQLAKINPSEDLPLDFLANSVSAGAATVASSPFNFVRSMHYATPPGVQPRSTFFILKNVCMEAKTQGEASHSLLISPLKMTGFFRQRFNIGWGTGRVAAGMAVGQKVFDELCSKLSQ